MGPTGHGKANGMDACEPSTLCGSEYSVRVRRLVTGCARCGAARHGGHGDHGYGTSAQAAPCQATTQRARPLAFARALVAALPLAPAPYDGMHNASYAIET